jgi:uncharacterized protein (DUF983 family)
MADRGHYDYNHATSGTQHAVTVILIVAVICILGGLSIGLNVLDHL